LNLPNRGSFGTEISFNEGVISGLLCVALAVVTAGCGRPHENKTAAASRRHAENQIVMSKLP
jgi:hypothetical protein